MTLLTATLLMGAGLVLAGIGLAVLVSVCCAAIADMPDPWEDD